jgi:LemA protein
MSDQENRLNRIKIYVNGRIFVSRTSYNDGVRDYNLHLRTFPNNVFNEHGFLGANAWGYKQYPQYEATQQAGNIVPQVNLNLTG